MIRNKPLVNAVTGLLALVAFILLLLCTISSPIVKGINLFKVSTSSNTNPQEVSFGVFGGCGTTSNFRRFGSGGPSVPNMLICTPTELSYEILTTESYQNPSGSYSFRSQVLVDHNTTSGLIMNPIAAGLAALAMILASIAALLRGRVVHGMTAVIVFLGALLSWATFGLNLAIPLMVQNASSVMGVSRTSTFSFEWGAVMPLSLVAAILLSVAAVLSGLSFFLIGNGANDRYRYGNGGEKWAGRGSTSTY